MSPNKSIFEALKEISPSPFSRGYPQPEPQGGESGGINVNVPNVEECCSSINEERGRRENLREANPTTTHGGDVGLQGQLLTFLRVPLPPPSPFICLYLILLLFPLTLFHFLSFNNHHPSSYLFFNCCNC